MSRVQPGRATPGGRARSARSRSGHTVAVPAEVAVLRPFVEAAVLDSAEVQLAAAVARLSPGLSGEVVLALAVAARGPRLGHVCVDLSDVARRVVADGDGRADTLPWPPPDVWAKALEASDVVVASPLAEDPLVPAVPLVWDGRRLYLQRYWQHERIVSQELRARSGVPARTVTAALASALSALFPDPARAEGRAAEPDLQRRAAELALTGQLTIVAGGPGTGKTHTVARLLAAAYQAAGAEHAALEVALAAPTGKAAARMTEALQDAVSAAERQGIVDPDVAATLRASRATTLHRLLGWAPGAAFRHHRGHPLPHDLVVVDETSMVSLPMMSHLLAALRPEARLVLVGDPFQLASVEAGSVLRDVVGPVVDPEGHGAAAERPAKTNQSARPGQAAAPLASRIVVLRQARRFSAGSPVADLAAAIRVGDADRALEILAGPGSEVSWLPDASGVGLASVEELAVDAAVDVVTAALAGDAPAGLEAASRVKVLCATRRGPLGQQDWNERIERATAARVPELRPSQRWYVGRPVMVTANDHVTQVSNGDVGLVVRAGPDRAVALPVGAGIRFLPAARLEQVETWWSMTIHKSQGSELAHVVVSLPSVPSPILSRELLYTAVTRARQRVTVIASPAAVRAAIGRPVARASGLRDELWPPIHRGGHTPPLLSRT